jgi:acetyltransferase-like isoleucine patch superfamily enzyme
MKKNMNNIHVDNLILGKNVFISESATIRGLNGNSKKIVIGDNTYIGDNVQIIIDELTIGDYCKIHHHSNIHGYKPLSIGHNAWVGQGTIIDSIGGVTIGNNCGIGAYSQLWSHIRYGDPLEGCNYESEKKLIIGNDVWFVGHCVVSPIIAEDKSMALVGSVITKNMEFNHIYGGSPAKDLTDKITPQFREITIHERRKIMSQFKLSEKIKLIENDSEIISDEFSYFNIVDRTYTKKGTDEEILFMKDLQNKLIKFIPKK